MKKLANFIVEKRIIILTMFILLALICVWLSTKVSVNTDMSKYLPVDSLTKIGIDIMESEFPETCSVNVIFSGLSESDKMLIFDELSEIENVKNVSYDADKDNKDEYTLYGVTISFDAYSPEAAAVVDTIQEKYPDIFMSGEAAGNLTMNLALLFSAAIAILLVILFLMCNSWIEPLLFLVNIGVAILLNMGTNVIFDSVSDITKSISSILQLVLSMDYSIMLLNRYRQEKQTEPNKFEAMKKALVNAFVAISSSSITTIVGMLMLVFMSFTIGMDLGLVLAKGVFFSLLCIFTVLASLILMADKLIEKTAKKSLHIKMDKIASFEYSARIFIFVGFIIFFAGSFLLRSNVDITYTMNDYNKINQVFTPNNSIVVVYESSNESKIAPFANKLEEHKYVDSVNAYSTTLGKEMTYKELSAAVGMDETLIGLMYNYYFSEKGVLTERKIVFGDFLEFLTNDVAANEQFSSFFVEDTMAQLDAFGGEIKVSAEEFAVYSGMEEIVVQQVFGYYFNINGQTEDGKIEMTELTQFLMTDIAANPQFAPMFTEDVMVRLSEMSETGNVTEREMTSAELAEYINMDAAITEQLYNFYAVVQGDIPNEKISLYEFMKFITDNVAENESFKPYFTGDTAEKIISIPAEMDDGIKQLVGVNYSRLIINTSLKEESDETFAFLRELEQELSDIISGKYYIVGSSAIAYEMSVSFPSENNFITILTAIAIFIVVAIAFRSLSIPIILVSVIQCAVFITMGAGSSIYYLPLLIVQCLLMGATIDYGILYTTYYREARTYANRKESVKSALNNSIHTILTSGLILVGVTFILGFAYKSSNQAVSEILLTIGKGACCSMVLVVFVLPGLLATWDRFICRKK